MSAALRTLRPLRSPASRLFVALVLLARLVTAQGNSVPDRPQMGGYELIVNADILRGRYWKSFARATPVPANTVTSRHVWGFLGGGPGSGLWKSVDNGKTWRQVKTGL